MRKCLYLACVLVACAPSGLKVADEDSAVGEGGDAGIDGGHELDAGELKADGGDGDGGAEICYLDWDHDGVGAGDPVPCDYEAPATADVDAGAADAGTDAGAAEGPAVPQVVSVTGDCDDDDARRAPGLVEACDGVDNDCDDDADEGAMNACGGACPRPLEHEPGEACTNGLLGACVREGTFECVSTDRVECNAAAQAGSSELCGDEVDNDCDGAVDEPDAVDATTWYQDCDADGFSASTVGTVKGCTKPANAGECTWTAVVPQESTRTNWDCNDASASYSPRVTAYGFAPDGILSYDLNCDGVSEKAPNQAAGAPTPCTATLVQHFNDGYPLDDCSALGSVSGCVIWRSGETYARAPQAFCPDSGGFRVNIEPYRDQSGNQAFRCTTESTGTVQWPCR